MTYSYARLAERKSLVNEASYQIGSSARKRRSGFRMLGLMCRSSSARVLEHGKLVIAGIETVFGEAGTMQQT